VEDLSLHILDIAENSAAAGATLIDIAVTEELASDLLMIEITDNGAGMDKEFLDQVLDPFVTTKKVRRIGLGLSLFDQAAARAGGEMRIESAPGQGTKVVAKMRHGHIDRQPMGDLPATIISLVVGYPEIDIRYRHNRNGECFEFDTRDLRAVLGDERINSGVGLRVLRQALVGA
jgi:hypothetical protein